MPRLAAEVASVLHTPLPAILDWTIDELLFWHDEACRVAGV